MSIDTSTEIGIAVQFLCLRNNLRTRDVLSRKRREDIIVHLVVRSRDPRRKRSKVAKVSDVPDSKMLVVTGRNDKMGLRC